MTAPEPLWKYDDVAAYLRLSKRWIQNEVVAGRIPHSRYGSSVRFDPHEIRLWNAQRTRRVNG